MKIFFNTIILLFLALYLSSCSSSKQFSHPSATMDGKPYSIENCVNTFSFSRIESTKVGYQFWFADKNLADGKTIKMSVVAPHKATHPPHKHSEDEFFFVLEGTAEFYLAGKTVTGGPMTSFYCPSFVEHGIRNVGDTELKYLVIKQYEQ